jgi:hypothetical protein
VPVASDHETSASQQSGTKQFSKVFLLPVGSEKQAKALGQGIHWAGKPNIVSTLSANGGQVMGPEILLWCYPNNDIVNGSLLQVESHQFCVLKFSGTILKVYEAGQYIVQPPNHPLMETVQLGFDGSSIPWQYTVLYVNRAKLVVKASGVAHSREMAEVTYSVDYAFHVARCEDVVQLIGQMPYQGHTLSTKALNAHTGPAIEQAVNQRLQVTPLLQVQKRRQDLSQFVYQQLQKFLSSYGITLDEVNVQVTPRDEHIKSLLSLRAFGLSKLDALHYHTLLNNSKNNHREDQEEYMDRKLRMIWRDTQDRYTDGIATIHAELESARADLDQRMEAHNAYLQQYLHAISSDVQANVLALDSPGTPPADGTS